MSVFGLLSASFGGKKPGAAAIQKIYRIWTEANGKRYSIECALGRSQFTVSPQEVSGESGATEPSGVEIPALNCLKVVAPGDIPTESKRHSSTGRRYVQEGSEFRSVDGDEPSNGASEKEKSSGASSIASSLNETVNLRVYNDYSLADINKATADEVEKWLTELDDISDESYLEFVLTIACSRHYSAPSKLSFATRVLIADQLAPLLNDNEERMHKIAEAATIVHLRIVFNAALEAGLIGEAISPETTSRTGGLSLKFGPRRRSEPPASQEQFQYFQALNMVEMTNYEDAQQIADEFVLAQNANLQCVEGFETACQRSKKLSDAAIRWSKDDFLDIDHNQLLNNTFSFKNGIQLLSVERRALTALIKLSNDETHEPYIDFIADCQSSKRLLEIIFADNKLLGMFMSKDKGPYPSNLNLEGMQYNPLINIAFKYPGLAIDIYDNPNLQDYITTEELVKLIELALAANADKVYIPLVEKILQSKWISYASENVDLLTKLGDDPRYKNLMKTTLLDQSTHLQHLEYHGLLSLFKATFKFSSENESTFESVKARKDLALLALRSPIFMGALYEEYCVNLSKKKSEPESKSMGTPKTIQELRAELALSHPNDVDDTLLMRIGHVAIIHLLCSMENVGEQRQQQENHRNLAVKLIECCFTGENSLPKETSSLIDLHFSRLIKHSLLGKPVILKLIELDEQQSRVFEIFQANDLANILVYHFNNCRFSLDPERIRRSNFRSISQYDYFSKLLDTSKKYQDMLEAGGKLSKVQNAISGVLWELILCGRKMTLNLLRSDQRYLHQYLTAEHIEDLLNGYLSLLSSTLYQKKSFLHWFYDTSALIDYIDIINIVISSPKLWNKLPKDKQSDILIRITSLRSLDNSIELPVGNVDSEAQVHSEQQMERFIIEDIPTEVSFYSNRFMKNVVDGLGINGKSSRKFLILTSLQDYAERHYATLSQLELKNVLLEFIQATLPHRRHNSTKLPSSASKVLELLRDERYKEIADLIDFESSNDNDTDIGAINEILRKNNLNIDSAIASGQECIPDKRALYKHWGFFAKNSRAPIPDTVIQAHTKSLKYNRS